MHSAVIRSLKVLVPAVMSLFLATSPVFAAPPSTTANAPASGCANRETPPPPVDTSEKPLPGKLAPAPLPVPVQPQGGPRMAECDTIVPKNALNPPEVTSASWVLQDLDTGAVLAAKNPHARQRPASLIKTLLALVVVTELKPDQVISPTKVDAEQECTCVGIVAGGKYTVDQLLHGLLMHSGNDVAHTFATALGGVDATLAKMNGLAAKIGALDTRAASPSGLDAAGMSTSAYDLSVIFHYAMKQPDFAKAVATKEFQWPAMGEKPSFPLYNDNKLLGVYPGFLGGKTGFTDDARHTYVGGAIHNGKRVAVVTMRGEQRPTRIVDQATKLLDYGFALEASRAEPVGQIPYKAGANGKVIPDPQDNSTPNSAAASPEDRFGTVGWILTLVVALIIVAGFTLGHLRRKAAGQDS